MKRNNNKKGFTLAELLIVIAIIAILIAIAIPVFSSQLRAARLSTDHANIRSAYAWAQSANLMGQADTNGDGTYDATEDNATTVTFYRDGTIADSAPSGTTAYTLMVTAKDDGSECQESPACKIDSGKSTHQQNSTITIEYDDHGGEKSWEVTFVPA